VQGPMKKTSKKHAPVSEYVSPNQLVLKGFETPFYQKLETDNRWVALSSKIPWDDLVSLYNKHNKPHDTGRPSLNPRLVIGSMIIKHMLNLDDRETVSQIRENMYMQYFVGFSSYCKDQPFDPSLFVDIRNNRLSLELIAEMNKRIYGFHMEKMKKSTAVGSKEGTKTGETKKDEPDPDERGSETAQTEKDGICTAEGAEKNPAPPASQVEVLPNKGEVIFDATVCPQDIAYPTDLGLLNTAREITEEIIDCLHPHQTTKQKKPRTYREVARKKYLKIAQNKNPSKKSIRKGIKTQLQYLKRNFKSITKQLDSGVGLDKLGKKLYREYLVIQTVYDQQLEMFEKEIHQVDHRIVSIHQPHVRPIVRGKSRAKTEFGAKIHLSLVDGYSFLDTLSWEAFNEGSQLMAYVEDYKKRFGFYPAKVLADQIYCTRENRKKLKELDIKLAAKPLGRPSAKAVENQLRPGERNPIEGKFGKAKTGYGMNRIKARLKDTSESWIASIILVLNLVKLAGQALLCLSFSAWILLERLLVQAEYWIFSPLQDSNPPRVNFGRVWKMSKS